MSTDVGLLASSDPHVFLIGRPPISELFGFIRAMAVNGQNVDFGSLTAEWRAANDRVLNLEKDEAGLADGASVASIAESLGSRAAAVTSDPIFLRAYQFVPTDVGVIDLNRVVVFQKFINLSYVDDLKARLGSTPSAEAVFDFALPLRPFQPNFRMMQNNTNTYTFVSSSTDFRFLEPRVLQPQDVPNFQSTGRPVVIIGLAVGYGSNFLNVIQVENRLILANGSHRAYALRDLGIDSIPCLIQRVTRREELEVVAPGDLGANPDRYLKSPRPPMLRDYFDPALRKIVSVYRKNRVVRVQFGLEQSDTPAQ